MSAPGNLVSRSALEVTSRQIAALSDSDLCVLMEKLIKAQAYKCDSPLRDIVVNTEGNASDDGSDGWSAKPARPDDWLGSEDTCWQFKAGTAGTPKKISGEVLKPTPRLTLIAGGRFVVVASGSKSGRRGLRLRLATLVQEAKDAGLPTEKIEVIGSEGLATWCNQHPAIKRYVGGYPEGLWSFRGLVEQPSASRSLAAS